jgi:two-component system OmpR family response regulator
VVVNSSFPAGRVLCVDDNRDCADSTAQLLSLVAFDAIACYGGTEAVALNQTFRPSLCFIDLHMPEMDGDELATRLQAGSGWRPLLLVAVTAASDELSRERTHLAGFNLHLVKPVNPTSLLKIVDRLFKAIEATWQTNNPHGPDDIKYRRKTKTQSAPEKNE